MNIPYYIGLDIGTNSVGWAVIDTGNNLNKHKNMNMWGTRLFNEAQTAQKRRISRSSRRRLNKRRKRIDILQSLMEKDIKEIDPNFYKILKESFLHMEDRFDKRRKHNLFTDKNYTDKDFYDKYKTIYHLRQDLIESKDKKDIRLIYLAMHHIIKYRGNFLHEGKSFDNIIATIEYTYNELSQMLLESGGNIKLDIGISELENILKDRNTQRKLKLDKLQKLNSKDNKEEIKEIFNAILGFKANYNTIFAYKGIELDKDTASTSFNDTNIEERLEKLEIELGEDYEIVNYIKSIYDWNILNQILQGKGGISQAKIQIYEKHKSELKILKQIIRKYDKKLYKQLFKNYKKDEVSYHTYIKNRDGKLTTNDKTTVKQKIYKIISEFINDNLKDDFMTTEKQEILNKIENDDYLVIQTIKDNGQIPYQLNKIELEKIIENQSKYYKTLEENKDKILSILEYRIPYYLGPLSLKSSFGWVVKKEGMENEKMYPWCVDKIVDDMQTAEAFIKKMTNKCTYLTDKDVLPRNSILFSEYMFFNEINKIKIDGYSLDKNEKIDLFNEVFMKNKVIKTNKIIEWAKKQNNSKYTTYKVEGLQGDDKAATSLIALIDFKRILNLEVEEMLSSENKIMLEKIIEWITIFEDKKILIKKIEKEYPKLASDKSKLDKIVNLRYKGWARLSKELIDEIHIDRDNGGYGGKKTILYYLKNGYKTNKNPNFMQIINDKDLGFNELIKKENTIPTDTKINYKNLIENLQGSPAIKRGIWQSIQIIEEIIKIKKYKPEKIFIEFAREDQDSNRTLTRQSAIKRIYKEIKDNDHANIKELEREIGSLNNVELKDVKKFLYFKQLGKCLYSKEQLDIDKLYEYEIDHIIYRSLTPDDSIDNLALVKRKHNQDRSNNQMPLAYIKSTGIDSVEVIKFWEYLKDKKLMSDKKYNNLRRETNLTKYEIEGFINRQLVETRQISKHLVNLLTNIYKEEIDIITIKANLVSDFRHKYDLYKLREVNDYHHGHDAFLTSVVGNYIQQRFPKLGEELIYEEYQKLYKDKTKEEQKKNKYGFIISSMNYTYEKDDNTIWDKNKDIEKIKKQLNYKDMYITKKVFENKGEFYKGSLRGTNDNTAKGDKRIPIKKNLDTDKYGYYEGIKIAYTSIIEYKKGKKIKKEVVGLPIMLAKTIKNNDDLVKYYEEKGYEKTKIIKSKIYMNQLIVNEKGEFFITSDGEINNAKQLILPNDVMEILYKSRKTKYKDYISDEKLIYAFDKIVEKSLQEYKIFNDLYIKIKGKKENFEALDRENKVKILFEMLKITQANATNANLKEIGRTNREGRLKKSPTVDKTTYIYQSITGMIQYKESY